MRSTHDYRTVKRTVLKALDGEGERESKMRFRWDLTRGRCRSPVTRRLFARPMDALGREKRTYDAGTTQPLDLDIETPCRKCEECLQDRRKLWTARAFQETDAASRTWMGTFTFAPEHRLTLQWSVEKRLAERSVLFETLSPDEQWREIASASGREVQLWLKRLRKKVDPVRFRFLAVCEAHADGYPHWHMLIHECSHPITWDDLQYVAKREKGKALPQQMWKYGFTHFKLIERAAAPYICKYLSKSMLARVRASVDYGGSDRKISNEVKKKIMTQRKSLPEQDEVHA